MTKSAKIIIGILVLVVAVAIGFAIAYLVQAGPGEPKEISFSILVSSQMEAKPINLT